MRIQKGNIYEGKTYHGSTTRDPSGKDECALWIGNESYFTVRHNQIFANAVAEGLKIHNSHHGKVYGNIIHGGYEDCIDILGCSDIDVYDNIFVVKGRTCITAKGGNKLIKIRNNRVNGTARHGSLFDIGGHTIYPDRDPDDHYHIHGNIVKNWNLSLCRTWRHGSNIVIEKNEGSFLFKNIDIPNFLVDWYFGKEDKK